MRSTKMLKAEEGQKLVLNECPFCGGNEYVVKRYVKGMIPEVHSFKDNTITENNKLDKLKTLYISENIYCNSCKRRICSLNDIDMDVKVS